MDTFAGYDDGYKQAVADKETAEQEAADATQKAEEDAEAAKQEAEGAAKKADAEEAAKPSMTKSQEQAIGSAEDYLNSSHFSKKGLIEQLEYEEFSKKDAKFAVAHIKVNWNKQAAGSAEDYLDSSSLLPLRPGRPIDVRGLHTSQAEYGVAEAGL